MYDKLEILSLANGLARHASARQAAIASNVANADTPGYRARDVADFATTLRAEPGNDALRASRAGHIGGKSLAEPLFEFIDAPGPSKPNGNTVSLETEMVKAAEVRQQHDLALSVYQSSLGILRTALGRGR